MSRVTLEEPLGHVRRDVTHILAPRADGEGHEHVRGLAKLGFEACIPPLGKALGQVLDVLWPRRVRRRRWSRRKRH